MATGALAAMGMRAKLRGIRATDGTPIFKSDMQGTTQYALDGAPMYFPQNGSFDSSIAQLVVGDFKQAVYSIRQDITVKILDQGVIQDPSTKEIVYNLDSRTWWLYELYSAWDGLFQTRQQEWTKTDLVVLLLTWSQLCQ